MKPKSPIDAMAALSNIKDLPTLPGYKAVMDDAYVYIQNPNGTMRIISLQARIWCAALEKK